MLPHQAWVDQLIDEGLRRSPATDWSLILHERWLADLPLDGDTLVRPVDTRRAGYFRTPVYRGLELVPQPLTQPVLILTDAAGLLSPLYLNTDTGQIGASLADIGLTSHDE